MILAAFSLTEGRREVKSSSLRPSTKKKKNVRKNFFSVQQKKKNLLARLFSSSIFPLRWLEVVQASVKVRPFFLSAYLVSRSPTMIPVLLSR